MPTEEEFSYLCNIVRKLAIHASLSNPGILAAFDEEDDAFMAAHTGYDNPFEK